MDVCLQNIWNMKALFLFFWWAKLWVITSSSLIFTCLFSHTPPSWKQSYLFNLIYFKPAVLQLIHQGTIFNHIQPSLHLHLQLVLLQKKKKKHLKVHIYKVRHHLVLYRNMCMCIWPTEPAPNSLGLVPLWVHLTRVRVSLLIPWFSLSLPTVSITVLHFPQKPIGPHLPFSLHLHISSQLQLEAVEL